jgi:hypothetical protein
MFVFVELRELKLQGKRMTAEELHNAATGDVKLALKGERPPWLRRAIWQEVNVKAERLNEFDRNSFVEYLGTCWVARAPS